MSRNSFRSIDGGAARGEGDLPTLAKVASLATMLGVTKRRVEQIAKELEIERPAPGMYPLQQFVTAYVASLRNRAASATARSDTKARAELKDRLLRVQVDNAELDFQERVKAVTSAAAVEGEAYTEGIKTRDAFLKLGGRLCMELSSESSAHAIRSRIDEAVRETLENLSEGEDQPDDG